MTAVHTQKQIQSWGVARLAAQTQKWSKPVAAKQMAAHNWLVLSQHWKHQHKLHLEKAAVNLALCLDPLHAEGYYLRCESREYGDLRSLSDLAKAIALAPDQPLYQEAYISRLIAHGFVRLALKALDQFILTFPDLAEAYFQRADLHLQAHTFKAAVRDFAEAEARGYCAPLMYLQWGYSLRALKQFKQGNLKLKKGLELWWNEYQQRGIFFEQALSVLAATGEKLILPESGNPSETDVYALEQEPMAADHLEEAGLPWIEHLLPDAQTEAQIMAALLEISAQALALSPTETEPEAWLLEVLGFLPRAAENPELLFIQAEALIEMQQAERALPLLKRGLNLVPGYPQGLRLLLEAYQALAEFPQMLKIYAQLEKQAPLSAYDYKQRAELQQAVGNFQAEQKDNQRAIQIFTRAFLQKPPDPSSSIDLIAVFLLFQAQNKTELWLLWLNRFIQLYPQQAQLWYLRGLTQAEGGNKGAALVDLNQALVLEPDSTLFAQALQKVADAG